MHARLRAPARGVALAAITTGLILGSAVGASAHVTVSSPDAAPGGFGKIVFRVPTESATASTNKLTVTLPSGAPFGFVSTKAKPGWSVATSTRALDKPMKVEGFTLNKVVATVTWTSEGDGIKPGEFDEFELSVGPFPDKATSLKFVADQSYTDGTVVRWDQPTPASGEEPEHPAPVLDLTGGNADGDAAADDGTARWVAGGAAVIAVAALGLAGAGLARRRS